MVRKNQNLGQEIVGFSLLVNYLHGLEVIQKYPFSP
jgi:hypothetical protein